MPFGVAPGPPPPPPGGPLPPPPGGPVPPPGPAGIPSKPKAGDSSAMMAAYYSQMYGWKPPKPKGKGKTKPKPAKPYDDSNGNAECPCNIGKSTNKPSYKRPRPTTSTPPSACPCNSGKYRQGSDEDTEDYTTPLPKYTSGEMESAGPSCPYGQEAPLPSEGYTESPVPTSTTMSFAISSPETATPMLPQSSFYAPTATSPPLMLTTSSTEPYKSKPPCKLRSQRPSSQSSMVPPVVYNFLSMPMSSATPAPTSKPKKPCPLKKQQQQSTYNYSPSPQPQIIMLSPPSALPQPSPPPQQSPPPFQIVYTSVPQEPPPSTTPQPSQASTILYKSPPPPEIIPAPPGFTIPIQIPYILDNNGGGTIQQPSNQNSVPPYMMQPQQQIAATGNQYVLGNQPPTFESSSQTYSPPIYASASQQQPRIVIVDSSRNAPSSHRSLLDSRENTENAPTIVVIDRESHRSDDYEYEPFSRFRRPPSRTRPKGTRHNPVSAISYFPEYDDEVPDPYQKFTIPKEFSYGDMDDYEEDLDEVLPTIPPAKRASRMKNSKNPRDEVNSRANKDLVVIEREALEELKKSVPTKTPLGPEKDYTSPPGSNQPPQPDLIHIEFHSNIETESDPKNPLGFISSADMKNYEYNYYPPVLGKEKITEVERIAPSEAIVAAGSSHFENIFNMNNEDMRSTTDASTSNGRSGGGVKVQSLSFDKYLTNLSSL